MFTWIKANALHLMGYALLSSIASLAIMFTLWQGAQHDAQIYRNLSVEQARIITAQDNVVRAEHKVTRIVEHVTERIMEQPHATDPFPPDVASAWSDGIDCLRALHAPTTGNSTHVPGPCPSETVSGGPAERATGIVQR